MVVLLRPFGKGLRALATALFVPDELKVLNPQVGLSVPGFYDGCPQMTRPNRNVALLHIVERNSGQATTVSPMNTKPG